MVRLVKIGNSFFNPEHVAAVLPRTSSYQSYVVTRNGDKYSVDQTATEVAEALIGPPPYDLNSL